MLSLSGSNVVSNFPHFIAICTANHYLNKLVTTISEHQLGIVIPKILAQQARVDCSTLAELLLLAAQHLVKVKALSSAVGSSAWGFGLTAVKSWSQAIILCHQSSSTERAVLSEKETSKVESAKALVGAVANAGLSGLTLAVCCEEGCAALSCTFESLEQTADSSKDIINYWKSIIACTHFQPLTRGEWCSQYLHWACAKTTTGDISKAILTSYELVENVVKQSAPATMGSDMTEFYASLLEVQTEVLNSQGITKAHDNVIEFTRKLAERATTVCPSERRFWDIWENLGRQLGDHQKANHIQWKKDKAF